MLNAELLEGDILRLNFTFTHRDARLQMYLDSPHDTTFLTDQLGRQWPLSEAVGITADRPVVVPQGGTRRFELRFAVPAGVESFKYYTTLLIRTPDGPGVKEERLQIQIQQAIRLSEFR